MVRSTMTSSWQLHAFVECRRQGGAWWLYAAPVLEQDEQFDTLLCSRLAEASELGPLCDRGVPRDVSAAVRDQYSWRIAGPRSGGGGNIVSVAEASAWLTRGASVRWTAGEPFDRVSDPRWAHPTWVTVDELAALLDVYQWRAEVPPPATHAALLAMAQQLEQEYLVRVVLWLEHRFVIPGVATSEPELPARGDDHERLEQARARVRRRQVEAREEHP